MEMEQSARRVQVLGTDTIERRKPLSVNEMLERLYAVDQEQIAETARVLFAGPRTLAAVGTFQKSDLETYLL